jgi:hypothetical protein
MNRFSASRPFGGAAAGLALALLAAAVVGLGAPVRGAQEETAARQPVTQRLVLAHYYYHYQGDPRKPVPARGLRNPQGLSVLTSHPWESVGPWMSFDRAQWHKGQLQMMAAGGVDVALAMYRGDRASRRSYALKGLDVLTQALKELRAEGQGPLMKAREYPLIGMALDLGGLAEQYGGPVNLKDPDVQKSLYGMVRDFYLHVPEEFRATVQLPASRLGDGAASPAGSAPRGAAYIVRLYGDGAVKDADGTFVAAVNRRFLAEFGARLVWVGTPELVGKVKAFDASAPFPAATKPVTVTNDGWLRVASLGPGYDDSNQGTGGTIRPRENGQQAILDFRKAMSESPDWMLLDSWNGYSHGTQIAPTLQDGLLYRDLLRAAVLQYKQSADYAAHFLRVNAPRIMQPGSIYQVEVAVQNSGTSDWDVFNVASLSYRWIKDGQPVGDRGVGLLSPGQARGDTKHFLIGVAAPIEDGKPLPAGEYELEFNMTRRAGVEDTWFPQDETAPYRIPVTVGQPPAARPAWIDSGMPALAKSGAAYPAQIRVRNDGSETWKKGAVTVGYRWRKVSTYLKGAAADADEVVAEGKRVPIDADAPPGRLVSLEVPVSTTDGNKPLPVWSPQDEWTYVLEWDVHDGQKYLSQAGGAVYREPVEVLDRDIGVGFAGCNLGNDLVAGRTEKITVGLVNNGPDAWKKGRDKVIVHWYYMDGSEASWHDDELPLQEDVPPFSRVTTQVPDLEVAGARQESRKQQETRKEQERVRKEEERTRKEEERRNRQEQRNNRSERERSGRGGRKMRTVTVVQPTVLREVPVRVPYYFGPMFCVLDFQHDGVYASSTAASKGSDLLVIPVNVFSPTFTPLPIGAYANVDGMSQDVDRGDGNIDGRGNSLPQEYLPPYVTRPSVGGSSVLAPSPLYPSGLWVKPLNDISASRVCFMYPHKANGTPNMVRAEGQRIVFGGLGRSAVHLLAVCTDEDVSAEFVLYYSDGTRQAKKLTFTHWNDVPKHGERIAFIAPHRHTATGDDPSTRCYLAHHTIPAEQLKQLVAVELPRQPAIKIVAVTLESAGLRAN